MITGAIVAHNILYSTSQRAGQMAMNALYTVRPDFYSIIQEERACNPFYDNENMHKFWDRINVLLDNEAANIKD